MTIEVMNHAKETFDRMVLLVKAIRDKELETWYRNTSMRINQEILSSRETFRRVYLICNAFNATVELFEKRIEQATKESERKKLTYQCCVSFYFICIQLGVSKFTDDFTKLAAFKEIVDIDDFSKCTKKEIDEFDYTRCIELIRYNSNLNEGKDWLGDSCFGINTALLISAS